MQRVWCRACDGRIGRGHRHRAKRQVDEDDPAHVIVALMIARTALWNSAQLLIAKGRRVPPSTAGFGIA